MMEALSIVGKRIARVDGVIKVKGEAQFCIDLELPRMLHAKIKRSTIPHGRIVRIDTSQAEKLPGVKAVMTAKDVPDKKHGLILKDRRFIARDRVRFVGEPVAAVAADTVEIAEEAIDLIEVEYDELPAVFDPEEAMKPDPPAILHPDLESYDKGPIVMPQLDIKRPNVYSYFRIRRGDVEQGFKEADLIVENRYTTAMIQHIQMEPHCAVAKVDPDGRITVWSSTQSPYVLRDQIAEALDIPVSKIRVIISFIGGGYGGKLELKPEPFCIILAQKTKRPVKLVFTREEVFIGASVRHPFVVYIKDGAKKDGTIIAREMKLILNGGASGEIGYIVNRNAAFGPVGSYKLPNFKLDGYGVYTNQPIGGAFRGLGSPQAVWPIEAQLDIVAEKLGIDPLEIRLKNALEEGDENVTGEKMHSVGFKQALQKVAEAIEWDQKPPSTSGAWRRGKGIAGGNKYSFASASAAFIKICEDETLEIRTSCPEVGQGAHTILSQIAAEEFAIPLKDIRVTMGDTDITPYDLGAASSRETYHMGNAVRLACEDAKRQIFELAADRLEARAEDLDIRDWKVYVKGSPERVISVSELYQPMPLGGKTIEKIGEIIGKYSFSQHWDPLDPDTGQLPPGGRAVAFYIHGAQAAEVEVNIETGQVRIIRFYSALDMGRAVNPLNVEGQIEGGIGMGIGSALYEQMVLDKGIVLNPNFADYKIPTAAELPLNLYTKAIIVEAPHRDGPFGAKGIGEGVLVPSAPAIANAIYNAVGVRIKDIPITPEKVFKALKERQTVK
jgi:CO/xanthine dehydrogenase Mo-binding subunit